jgi:tripartite-type tricarboxylate transporter receptor subunit TctC
MASTVMSLMMAITPVNQDVSRFGLKGTGRPRIGRRAARQILEPGAMAKVVANRHGISAGLLLGWRKEIRWHPPPTAVWFGQNHGAASPERSAAEAREKSLMPTRRHALCLALAAGLAPSVVRAQTAPAWRPTRPIRLIVPFAPGGSNDIVGRIIAESASQALGQPIVIENRAGAGSVIGAEHVARAAPDGHTVLINSAHSAVPAIVARVPYDTVNDFVGVAVAGFSPHVLVVSPQLPAKTAEELLALLKTAPGRYNLATAGIGSGVHVAAELFRSSIQAQVELVHYRGGGPSVAALAAGEAQVGTPTMASSIGQIRGGGLRALAVLAEQRGPALPDVPSAPEAGLPGVIFEEFFPILAPAGTPAPVVAALGIAFRGAIQQSAAKLNEMAGVSPRPGFETSEQVTKLVREGVERYTAILRAAGVQPE